MDKAVKKARAQLRRNEQERYNQMVASAINNQAIIIEQMKKQIEDMKVKNKIKGILNKIKVKFVKAQPEAVQQKAANA